MGAECPTCGMIFRTTQGMRQHHAVVHGENLPNRTCNICDVKFHDSKAMRTRCNDCQGNQGRLNPNWKDAKEIAQCKLCDEEFSFYPSDKPGVYCPKCVEASSDFLGEPYRGFHEAKYVEISCKYCNEEISVLKSEYGKEGRKFCSAHCFANWTDEHGSPRARAHLESGTTTDYTGAWRSIRRKARNRDGGKCRYCGKTSEENGRKLDVHHIIPVQEFEDPHDAHTLKNVISLCRSCHTSAENGTIELPDPNDSQ